MNPLFRIASLKLRLGIVIVAAIFVAVAAMVVTTAAGLATPLGVLIAIPLALGVVQILARGMTSPLREMARAADAMARGEHGQQVTAHGNDEVAQLAHAFNAMSLELAETDQQRRDLIAIVSHELRTPLSALQASLENISDGVEDASPQTLRAMQGQVARLGRMVNQLLDLSRIEAEGMPLAATRFSVSGLVDRVTTEGRLAGSGPAVVASTMPPDLQLAADEERIHQVLANLLENAIRVSPPSQPVEIAAMEAANSVRFEVTDLGPGVPEAERTRVFDRFYSADDSRSGNGAGLGLAISKWIVELHGGRIWIEEPGSGGCRVVFEVPARSPGDNGRA